MSKTGFSGGCQCGAIRFHCDDIGRASICHCRMCQKAFGSFYGPLVTVKRLKWTRGGPTCFQSSNKVRRGFCSHCGTPLTFEHPEGVEIAIGAFDEPFRVVPEIQLSIDTRVPYVDHLPELPVRETGEASYLEGIVSNQHPDHDTANWPIR